MPDNQGSAQPPPPQDHPTAVDNWADMLRASHPGLAGQDVPALVYVEDEAARLLRPCGTSGSGKTSRLWDVMLDDFLNPSTLIERPPT